MSYYNQIQSTAHMARGRLRDRHQENLKKKLELLKQQQGVEENERIESSIKHEPEEEVKFELEEEKELEQK